ncbi:MAG: xanthine dehydrogenase large subunit [Chthoniobacter sp.]|jgi:xanthine dehydrogenase molybdopterin binding subunit/xanthine dehydrogenase small subunit|nr:xanthine dehydrogenase large subunit [Chthoniobacter sp.]
MQGNTFTFLLNGERLEVRDVSPNTTLLDWLRRSGRVGTKCGCAEGDCGACTVALLDADAHGRPAWRSLNSCIALLPMFAGRELMTVEGLARGGELHPVQSCLVKHYGSQCGYCTPGFVMSLFEGYHREDLRERWQIADQLCGNLCRCTGYRPIRDAALELLESRTSGTFVAAKVSSERPDGPHACPTFLRPTSLPELLALKREFPAARLVAGATEVGVEINKKFSLFPRFISTDAVVELREIRATPEAWHLGAAVTLTAIEEALEHEFPSIDRMLLLFGSRQIRNRATLGGNLATASPIGDGAPVLLSLDASVVLVSEHGERTVPLSEFFTAYRQTAMRADEVLKSILVPRGRRRRAEFYKVSKRREMDISIVSAAFCVETDADGIVRHARLAFGGVAAMPARAQRAEERLVGKTLEAARGEVAEALRTEFTPIDDVRGSAAYRRAVVVSLWEKFCGKTDAPGDANDPDLEDRFADFVPSHPWPIDSASRALAHESAIGHVTGRAAYVDDTAQHRSMLELWPVCAPHAQARILRRDASEALKVPGVRAVLLAEDVPGHNNVGVTRKDEILLADSVVFFHGQIVAVVVGDTVTACREGASRVVVEYEPLPPILTVPEAIAADSFHTEPNFMRRGDWRAALRSSAHSIEGEFETGGQEHFYLETQAAWAEIDPDGNVFVASSTQHPSEIQTIVAEVLHLPRSRVVVQSPRMGGGFGGKETQGHTWAALTALAALKTGQPVRVQLDRDLDMQLTGKRHPFHARFRAGFDEKGHLQALQCELISNGGWSLDLSMPVTDRAMFHVDNAYYIPNLEVSGRVAMTNLTSQTAFRGFGGPQGMLVIEEIIDRVARRLGLPAHEVRERNLYHGSGETNTTHYGEEIGDNRIPAIWQQLLASSDFARRRAEIARWNARRERSKRGIAMTPVKFGISFTYTPYNQAGALVLIYRDGTAQVNHGGTEMGQGLHTKILGIAMRELGLPADRIRLMPTATDKVPNTSATAASSGSDLNGAAVRDACRQLRERLLPIAATMLGERFGRVVSEASVRFENAAVFAAPTEAVEFMEVVDRAYMQRLSLAASGYYATPGLHWDRVAGKGRPFHYYACGAAVSEVEVDGDTGLSKVLRVDILHDAGDSLNPGVDRGQIEGGFVQGMGWLTGEDLRWDAQGRLQSHSASTYQIPAFSDAPADFRVSLFRDATQTGVIHGSKAVGEPPLMLAISVREALREAVAAFGRHSGEIPLAAPATAEAIFWAIRRQQKDAVSSASGAGLPIFP